jgi:hypothetical protein
MCLSFLPRGRGVPVLALRSLCASAFLLAAACGDGGTGPGSQPVPRNPTPTISALDPVRLSQWSDSVTLTVTGSGFVNGAVVRVNGADRRTTYVSPSQVTAIVPPAQMQEVGTLQVTAFNPAPGGGESAALPLPVEHRVPTIRALSPGGSMQADSAFVLGVEGTGFARASVIRWNGADRPTTFVDPYHLTAQIPATDVAQAGTAQVTVFTPAPGGGTAEPRSFPIVVRLNPVPYAASVSPSEIIGEVGGTLTVTGHGFMEGTRVSVGGFSPTPTIVSPTELRFTLEPQHVPNTGATHVTVINPEPGGGASEPLLLWVNHPAPELTSISPPVIPVGQDSQTVRLLGSGFRDDSRVSLNGQLWAFRRISAGELQIVLRAADLDEVADYFVHIQNNGPGGGVTSGRLLVQNPAPVIESLSPAQAAAGQESLVVRVSGTGFQPGSVVRFQGEARETRFVSAAALDVVLTEADVAVPGSFSLTVLNPAPGGGLSSPGTLVLTASAPVLSPLPSYGASAGGAGFALVVHGSRFLPHSVVQWNGVTRTTRFISHERLEIDVTSADVASPATAALRVHTPGTGTSATRQLTIRAVGSAEPTSTRRLALSAVDIAYSPQHDRIYASISGSSARCANCAVAIDPLTGSVTDSVVVGSGPGRLALSDDGSTMWVALDGSGEVRRLSLPDLAPGLVFSLGALRVDEMHVMPGRTGTLAISLQRTGGYSPRYQGVAVYDNGVRRPVAELYNETNTIAWGEDGTVIYGFNNETTEAGFRTLRVQNDGVTLVRTTQDLVWPSRRMVYANGRVYTERGAVVDAARHVHAGAFALDAADAVAVDPALGRIYFVTTSRSELAVYDLNTFQRLGEATLATTENFVRERLVRWGADGLAMTDGSGIHIIRTPIAGP